MNWKRHTCAWGIGLLVLPFAALFFAVALIAIFAFLPFACIRAAYERLPA